MIELRHLGPEWDDEWDQLVGVSPCSGFMQSSAWMRFKRSEGHETLRCGLFEESRLLGGATLLLYPSDRLGGVICAPDGPILPWEDESATRIGLRLLQEEAKAFGEVVGAVAFRIEPRLPRPAPRILRNWRRAPVDAIPVDTLVIDCNRPLDELRAEMHPKARYNLGLSHRRGVTVRSSTEFNDLATFYGLFASTAARTKFFSEPYGYFLNLAASLFPANQAEVLIAEYEGEPASAMLLLHFGMRSTFIYGGSEPDLKRHMPNHALQWEAISRAHERGSAEYDLFGCDPHGCVDHPYYGFSRFKRQLGGRAVATAGAMDLLFYDRLAERMVAEMADAVG